MSELVKILWGYLAAVLGERSFHCAGSLLPLPRFLILTAQQPNILSLLGTWVQFLHSNQVSWIWILKIGSFYEFAGKCMYAYFDLLWIWFPCTWHRTWVEKFLHEVWSLLRSSYTLYTSCVAFRDIFCDIQKRNVVSGWNVFSEDLLLIRGKANVRHARRVRRSCDAEKMEIKFWRWRLSQRKQGYGGVWWSLRLTGAWILESDGHFCVGVFGRNLAFVAMKMFWHLVYFIKNL
jgi:hypothetical protein